MTNVSWNDAQSFCQWLNRKEPGASYRLPTEAEWEFACRAGSSSLYHFGDDPEELAKHGNVADGTAKRQHPSWTTIKASDGHVFTSPVGSFLANGWGLYDMHGNVWEWCSDWYGADFYRESPSTDPTGPAAGSFRVFRGGCWFRSPRYCRSAIRFRSTPDDRFHVLGLRVARSSSSNRQ